VLLVYLEALCKHRDRGLDILLVFVTVSANLIVKVSKVSLLLLRAASLASQFLYHTLLDLSCNFYVFSGVLVGAQVKRTLFFEVELVELKIRLYILFESVSRSSFLCKKRVI